MAYLLQYLRLYNSSSCANTFSPSDSKVEQIFHVELYNEKQGEKEDECSQIYIHFNIFYIPENGWVRFTEFLYNRETVT